MRQIRTVLMKRIGFLYEKICDINNIFAAIKEASKGKRNTYAVRRVLEDQNNHAAQIRNLLITKTYTPTPCTVREIRDPCSGKVRAISCPKFYPDQIIHWALLLQTRDILLRGSYEHSAGGLPGRGAHMLSRSVMRWLRKDQKNTKYFLKLDISKFYGSIDCDRLKQRLRKVIKDQDTLWLFDTIIGKARGLPIGYVTSVYLSDFYLQDVDHFIKEQLGVKHYARYVDDMVLFGPNKKKLHHTHKLLEALLSHRGLQIKENWQVSPIAARDVDFLGFRMNRHRMIMRKRVALRIRRRFRRAAKKPLGAKDAAALVSYWGVLKHCDSFHFRLQYIDPYVSLEKAKEVISHGSSRIKPASKTDSNRKTPER